MNIEELKRQIRKEVLGPTEDVKESEAALKAYAKADGLDYATAKQVAKAEFYNSEEALRQKAELTIEYL